MTKKSVKRRTFITSTAVAGSAMALPGFNIAQSKNPNSQVNVACIGVGGRGRSHLGGCKNENIVAICDVDFGRAFGKSKKKNKKKNPDADFSKIKQFTDYREMLDKMHKDIDAVTVCTPDHNHFPAAMASMQLGKHVCVEKPLTQTVWEAREIQKAAHHYKVISLMANQGHATEHIRLGKEWFEAGAIGEVKEVHVWNGGPGMKYFGDPQEFPPPPETPPETLNWDLWLGPRAKRPFSSYYVPLTWRGWWDFGNGPLGDWGCHTMDLPFWALNLDAPVSVQAKVGKVRFKPYVPEWAIVTWEFPQRGKLPPVKVTWYDGGKKPEPPEGKDQVKKGGMFMVGSKATLMTGGRPNIDLGFSDPEKFMDFKKNLPPKTIPRIKGKNHWEEWFHAIKGTGPVPGSNFDYATPLTQTLTLGTIAQRVPNKKLIWDNKTGKFTNSPEANGLLKSEPRKGWEYKL